MRCPVPRRSLPFFFAFAAAFAPAALLAQTTAPADGPDPKEIPVPPIATALGRLPGVGELPVRPDLPDVLVMNDGTKVSSPAQWLKRREEIKRTLEYYAIGAMPPPPGNVQGRELSSAKVADGQVLYRLVHLTFGPGEKLGLDLGIFTPAAGGPFPAIISPSGSPPGATILPRRAVAPGSAAPSPPNPSPPATPSSSAAATRS
jgi:hypothetical protein